MERERIEDPRVYEEFEWLAGLMAEMDRKAGNTKVFDEAYLARQLPRFIENNLELIRVAEELRAVIVRPMSPASLTPDVSGG
ncbi:MAG: hypothetical protein ABIP77_05970 [Candidatus Limnocylindrales bacterium]